nr:Peptidase M12A and Metridin ShK toxin domain containing protein [Haemonchus contortus]
MRLISLIFLSVLTVTVNSTTTINNEEFIDNAEVAIIDRIRNIGNGTWQSFHLTPKAKETLQELEELLTMKHDHFNPGGDYIDEINKKANIDNKLFQGDIYLNEVQGEIIIEELEEELEGANRTKRQAIRDRDGVRLWNNFTVNYIFNTTLGKDAKEAFLRGANMWTKDTCIRFHHDDRFEPISDVETLKQYDFLGDYAKSHENYAMCYYWIQSPENTEIEIELVSFSDEHALEGCPNAGVEIKTNRNQQLTGYRFCSPRDAGTKLRSYTNRVPIITWNRAYISQTVIRYKHVSKSERRPTTVRPTTRSTTWPTPTTIATTTHAVEEQQKCEDRPECPAHIANGFCYREGITHDQRKTYCPRGCQLCDE